MNPLLLFEQWFSEEKQSIILGTFISVLNPKDIYPFGRDIEGLSVITSKFYSA